MVYVGDAGRRFNRVKVIADSVKSAKTGERFQDL
jgi:hypothetical protein